MGPANEQSVLAAELALGLLDATGLQAARALLDSNPAFALEVAWWQQHAMTLFDGCEQSPSPSLWSSIVTRLPANDQDASRKKSTTYWRAAAGCAAAAALVLTVLLVRPFGQSAPPRAAVAVVHPFVAMLRSPETGAALAVTVDRSTRRLTTVPAGIIVASKSAELWIIPANGIPQSLGVIAAQLPQWRTASGHAVAQIAPGATLALSVEPLGGSPTGKPTGAVLMTGKLTAT